MGAEESQSSSHADTYIKSERYRMEARSPLWAQVRAIQPDDTSRLLGAFGVQHGPEKRGEQ